MAEPWSTDAAGTTAGHADPAGNVDNQQQGQN